MLFLYNFFLLFCLSSFKEPKNEKGLLKYLHQDYFQKIKKKQAGMKMTILKPTQQIQWKHKKHTIIQQRNSYHNENNTLIFRTVKSLLILRKFTFYYNFFFLSFFIFLVLLFNFFCTFKAFNSDFIPLAFILLSLLIF